MLWIRFQKNDKATNRAFLNSYRVNPAHPFYGFVGNDSAISTVVDAALAARLSTRPWKDRQFSDHMCPSRFLLVAPSGSGKTDFARRFAQLLRTPMAEVDGANLKSLEEIVAACQKAWIENPVVQIASLGPIEPTVTPGGRLITLPPMTLFIDEVHRLSQSFQDRLLKASDGDKDGFLILGDLRVDFRQVCIIAGTNQPGKLARAFKRRYALLSLEAPDTDMVAKIVRGRFPAWSEEACLAVANLVPVSRLAIDFAKEVIRAMDNMDDGADLMDAIEVIRSRKGIYRNGLTRRALQILRTLENNPVGMSRKMLLASVDDMEEEEFEDDVLPLLVATDKRPGRISTVPKHKITAAGLVAIEECLEEEYVCC